MMRRFALLAALALLAAHTLRTDARATSRANPSAAGSTPAPPPQPPTAQPPQPDPGSAFRFLIGSWEAKTTGGVAQAQASAGYAFRLELRDHILARHSRSGSLHRAR